VVELIIDGSFVTGKANPSDVDLVVVLASGHDFSADLRPFEYNFLSKLSAGAQIRPPGGAFKIEVSPSASN
jgi:predicted nucleotidyltransferase